MDVNLRCVTPQAAAECAEFLRGRGFTAEAQGWSVAAAGLSPLSVMFLAEEALRNGWAHADDAARIIAEKDSP